MFPVVKCSVSGLNPDENYAVVMDVVPAGENRFKFHDSEWVVTGKAEPMGSDRGRLYLHPDTPSSGAKWEKQLLTFQKCKITNNHLDQLGFVSCFLYSSLADSVCRYSLLGLSLTLTVVAGLSSVVGMPLVTSIKNSCSTAGQINYYDFFSCSEFVVFLILILNTTLSVCTFRYHKLT